MGASSAYSPLGIGSAMTLNEKFEISSIGDEIDVRLVHTNGLAVVLIQLLRLPFS